MRTVFVKTPGRADTNFCSILANIRRSFFYSGEREGGGNNIKNQNQIVLHVREPFSLFFKREKSLPSMVWSSTSLVG